MREAFHKHGIMQQHDVLAVWLGLQKSNAARFTPSGATGACNVNSPIRSRRLLIHEPRAARGFETRCNRGKIRIGPIIVIARNAVKRRLDFTHPLQRLRQKCGFFNQIARETDKIRRERIDFLHDALQKGNIPLVMQISKLHHSMRRLAGRNPDVTGIDPIGFKPAGIRKSRCWRQRQSGEQETAAAGFPKFHWLYI